jgi:hypothetical protein
MPLELPEIDLPTAPGEPAASTGTGRPGAISTPVDPGQPPAMEIVLPEPISPGAE